MTALQTGAACYFAVGAVRSYFLTRYYYALVEDPQGGVLRVVAGYMLLMIGWLPLDVLRWIVWLLPEDE